MKFALFPPFHPFLAAYPPHLLPLGLTAKDENDEKGETLSHFKDRTPKMAWGPFYLTVDLWFQLNDL
jgi:hypothetical protein